MRSFQCFGSVVLIYCGVLVNYSQGTITTLPDFLPYNNKVNEITRV